MKIDLTEMKKELEKTLDKIEKLTEEHRKKPLGLLNRIRYRKLYERSKKLQLAFIELKIKTAEEENKAFKKRLITEQEIRSKKIETLIDNMKIFDIADDEGKTMTTRKELEEKTTEWLTESADQSDKELKKIVGEDTHEDEIDFKQESGKQ